MMAAKASIELSRCRWRSVVKLLNAGETDAKAPCVLLDAQKALYLLNRRIVISENRVRFSGQCYRRT